MTKGYRLSSGGLFGVLWLWVKGIFTVQVCPIQNCMKYINDTTVFTQSSFQNI